MQEIYHILYQTQNKLRHRALGNTLNYEITIR